MSRLGNKWRVLTLLCQLLLVIFANFNIGISGEQVNSTEATEKILTEEISSPSSTITAQVDGITTSKMFPVPDPSNPRHRNLPRRLPQPTISDLRQRFGLEPPTLGPFAPVIARQVVNDDAAAGAPGPLRQRLAVHHDDAAVALDENEDWLTPILGPKLMQIARQTGNNTNPGLALNLENPKGMNLREFRILLEDLFSDDNTGVEYPLDDTKVEIIFNIFDWNSDGLLDRQELDLCYTDWYSKIKHPRACLIVVDVQNDFISGSLALKNGPAGQDGAEVIEPINWMLDNINFQQVYYSIDWHPENHISFVDNVHLRKLANTSKIQNASDVKVYDTVIFEGDPPVEQKLWPRHCVQNSWGAQLHSDLKRYPRSDDVYKGTNPDVDSYSALFDNNKDSCTDLVQMLIKSDVTDVYVCGLAWDYCVGQTAMDLLDLGARTILVEDATRGISFEGMNETRKMLLDNHAIIVKTDDLKSLVDGSDRRPELGFKLALEIHKEKIATIRALEAQTEETPQAIPEMDIGDPATFKLGQWI